TGVLDGVASSVERLVGVRGGGIDVQFRIVLDRGFVRGIIVGVLRARGEAEREDRNGQSNFLHDRSTPFLRATRTQRRPAQASRSGQTGGHSGNPYLSTRDYFKRMI